MLQRVHHVNDLLLHGSEVWQHVNWDKGSAGSFALRSEHHFHKVTREQDLTAHDFYFWGTHGLVKLINCPDILTDSFSRRFPDKGKDSADWETFGAPRLEQYLWANLRITPRRIPTLGNSFFVVGR